MIKSMTGFGKGEVSHGGRHIVCEIKSLNHRYVDIIVKMPKRYSFAEEKIKALVKEVVKRGKVEVSIQVDNISEEDVLVRLNTPIAKQYVKSLKELKSELELEGNIDLQYLASLPDVLKAIPDIEDEKTVLDTLEKAVVLARDNHKKMREIEGEKLSKDLLMRKGIIEEHLAKIEKRSPEIIRVYADKLKLRISSLLGKEGEISQERILTEAAIFADKASITEEIVRLNSHLEQMKDIISKDTAEGKKLDFLIQEMHREANTIGSKANDLDITNLMLEIKSEIEKIREQVQNIE